MATARDLILAMRAKGWQLWLDQGEVCFRAPRSLATAAEIETLRSRKTELLEALRSWEPVTISESSEPPPLRRSQRAADDPLTFTQQSFWDDAMTWGRVGETWIRDVRACATAMRILGPLKVDALRASLGELVRRHETLRTRIVLVDREYRQKVYEEPAYDLETVDLSVLVAEQIESTARRLVDEVVYEPSVHLFKARLLKVSDREHVFVLAMHHMIADEVSLRLIVDEVAQLYQQADQGMSPSLPALPIQYADYALWQHQSTAWWTRVHGGYWESRLANAPGENFAAEISPVQSTPIRLQHVNMGLNTGMSEAMRDLARRSRTTLALSVLAVYVATIGLWQNKNEWVIRYVIDGRDRAELEGMIGYLACVIYMRIQVRESDTYDSLLEAITSEYRAAYKHNDFGRLHALPVDCAWKRGAYVNWIPRQVDEEPGEGGLQLAASQIALQPFAITPFQQRCEFAPQARGVREPEAVFTDTAAGVCGVLSFPQGFFRTDAMEAVGRNFTALAATFLRRPDTLIRSCRFDPGL